MIKPFIPLFKLVYERNCPRHRPRNLFLSLFNNITYVIVSLIQELKKHNVKEVVRVCEPTYKVEELKSEGINVIDLVFDDGTFPPNEVIKVLSLHYCEVKLE